MEFGGDQLLRTCAIDVFDIRLQHQSALYDFCKNMVHLEGVQSDLPLNYLGYSLRRSETRDPIHKHFQKRDLMTLRRPNAQVIIILTK